MEKCTVKDVLSVKVMCLGKVFALQLIVTLPVVLSLRGSVQAGADTDAELRSQARQSAQKLVLIDTHIDHVVKLVGIDHVGFGSDFDGVEELPEGLQDVSGYPNLIYELLKRGYSEADLKKVCGKTSSAPGPKSSKRPPAPDAAPIGPQACFLSLPRSQVHGLIRRSTSRLQSWL